MTDDDWREWLNELMSNSCSLCWDQDEAMASIALNYVRHLEDNVPERCRHAWPGCEGDRA